MSGAAYVRMELFGCAGKHRDDGLGKPEEQAAKPPACRIRPRIP
jgi:hypothetical protein